MNIIVCIKQVPAKDAPLTIAGNWIRESDIGFEMNEPDSYALEEALRRRDELGEMGQKARSDVEGYAGPAQLQQLAQWFHTFARVEACA